MTAFGCQALLHARSLADHRIAADRLARIIRPRLILSQAGELLSSLRSVCLRCDSKGGEGFFTLTEVGLTDFGMPFGGDGRADGRADTLRNSCAWSARFC